MHTNDDRLAELNDAKQDPMDDAAETVDAVHDARRTPDGTSGVVLTMIKVGEEDPYKYL